MPRVTDIHKAFEGKEVFKKISLDFPIGEVTGLLGPNGTGKTTLLRILTGIIKQEGGEVFFEKGISIGYLPEERGLYKDLTVQKHLEYIGKLNQLKGKELHSSISFWVDRLKLIEYLNVPIRTLSKGNQQKVQFAVALIHNPNFLILDEPFSGFDPLNASLITDIIFELKAKGVTILLSTHRMDTVKDFCDNVIFMNEGNILFSGSLKTLAAQNFSGKFCLETAVSIKGIGTDIAEWDNEKVSEGGMCKYELVVHSKDKLLKYLMDKNIELIELLPKEPSIGEIFLRMISKR